MSSWEGFEARELTVFRAEQVDTACELWLTSAFVVVLTAHTMRNPVDTKLEFTVTALYLFLTAYTQLKPNGHLQQIAFFEEFVSLSQPHVPDQFAGVADYIRIAPYVIGTGAMVAVVRTTGRQVCEQ